MRRRRALSMADKLVAHLAMGPVHGLTMDDFCLLLWPSLPGRHDEYVTAANYVRHLVAQLGAAGRLVRRDGPHAGAPSYYRLPAASEAAPLALPAWGPQP